MANGTASQLGLPTLPTLSSSGSTSTNPLGTTAEDQLQVSGVGSLLRLNWGTVTVAQALSGFDQLAKAASGKGPGATAAKADLVQIQEELYTAGYYGSKKPKPGQLSGGGLDESAFRKAMVDAANSGEKAGDFLSTSASNAAQTGTSAGGTHIIPAARIQEKTWAPQDIQAAIDAATTATGENLAQKLIGRNFTAAELQGAADQLNSAQAIQTQADVAGVLSQQQQDIGTQNAVNGQPPAAMAGAGAPGTIPPPATVYSMILAAGGSQTQAQVGAALTTGPESSTGAPIGELSGGKGPAAGLFQFEPTTWTANGGTGGTAATASLDEQIKVFVNATRGNHFTPWGPDLVANSGNPNDPHNPNYGYSGPPQPGSKVANAIAQLGAQVTGGGSGGATANVASSGGKYSPVGSGLKRGRIDQGVDYTGQGQLYAVGSGQIVATSNAGWPGGTFIALKLDNPVDPQHSMVYYAENIIPNVKVGQHVQGGAVVGHATGLFNQHGGGIEIGWADPNHVGQALAAASGKYSEGTQTAAGQDFVSWIDSPGVSGVGLGGAQGTTTDVYQNPVVDQVPATLDPTEAATQYAETHMSKDYQTNNLLKMFQMVQTKLGSPDPNINPHVQTTPVVMK